VEQLEQLIKNECKKYRAELVSVEVMSDHIHLLVDVDPQFGVHKLIKRIKGMSSRVLRDTFRELRTKLPTLWTNSYFVATTGGVTIEKIKEYVENQKRSQR